jgi:hypothetical protein
MARKIFFSFHYGRDSWRAAQVRNCDLLPSQDEYGFIDSVEWESIERQGDAAVERWISDQMKSTSVTVVLIGSETAGRPWVQHEIVMSWNRGNGIVGVRIHNVKDPDRRTDAAGANPLARFRLPDETPLSSVCKVYDWVIDDGRNNLGKWIEEAFEIRGKFGAGDKLTEVTEASDRTEKAYFVQSASASVGFAPRSPWCADHAEE